MDKSKPTLESEDGRSRLLAYTEWEGGNWIKWVPMEPRVLHVHALLYEDGSVWDTVNGWRPKKNWYDRDRMKHVRKFLNQRRTSGMERLGLETLR